MSALADWITFCRLGQWLLERYDTATVDVVGHYPNAFLLSLRVQGSYESRSNCQQYSSNNFENYFPPHIKYLRWKPLRQLMQISV